MDLQELQRSVYSVVEDKNSTPECKKRFEKAISSLRESRAESVHDNLKRSVRFFESALMSVMDKPDIDPAYRQKIANLRINLRSISKPEVKEVLEYTRNALRASMPDMENAIHDEIFEYGESALDKRNPALLAETLQKIRKTHKPDAKLALLFCRIAQKLRDRKLMVEGLELLKDHCEDSACLRKFALLAKYSKNKEAMRIAMEKIERDLSDKRLLTLYATIARSFNDKERISRALELLGTRCDDTYCLNTFAIMAKTLGDEINMKSALEKLEKRLDDRFCLTTYATVARRLGDKKAMAKAQGLLEKNIGEDFRCLTAYAKNCIKVGTEEDPQKAMAGLKEYIEDPGTLTLYLEVAESDNTK